MSKKLPATSLQVKDHSVSGEDFSLIPHPELDLYQTVPVPKDLEKYYESKDYISHTDSRESAMDRVYHLARIFSIKMKLNVVGKYAANADSLLDIGAGTGEFLSSAGNVGYKAVGIEPSRKAREIARIKGCTFIDGISQVPAGSVDVVTMWHVLEHVPDVKKQLGELKRILKKKGVAIIAVPNFKSYDAQYYHEYWAAYDVPRHLWHFSKESIKALAAEAGFSVVAVRPMWLDAFYVALLSEKYKMGGNFINAMFIGLKSNLKAIKTGEFSSLIYVLKSE